MRPGRTNRIAALYGVAILILLSVVSGLAPLLGEPVQCDVSATPASESSPSVASFPLGLNGSITGNLLGGRLTEGGEELTFVATSSGLYILGADGKLRGSVLSGWGVSQVRLLSDITGDDVREVMVLLDNAPVPILRCYDGATLAKLWQTDATRRVLVETMGWAEVQVSILQLEILHGAGFEMAVMSSTQSLFCIDARNGRELWRFERQLELGRFAVVSDAEGDGVDDLIVGSQDGVLYFVEGQTGRATGELRLPEGRLVSPYGSGASFQAVADDFASLGTNKIVVTSTDGELRLVDLQRKECDWNITVGDYDDHLENLRISVTSDTTGDGLPEILIAECGKPGDYPLSVGTPKTGVTLVDSGGNKVWEKELNVSWYTGVQIAEWQGRAVILEPDAYEVRIVDVQTAELIQTIQRPTSDGEAIVATQLGTDTCLLVSDVSDAVVLSCTGVVLWSYPRVGHVDVETGHLTSDETQDFVFFCASGQGDSTRLLSVMDGVTKHEVWSYAVPLADFAAAGGLNGIELSQDVVGNDGIDDIVGWRGSEVVIFSGSDGSISTFSVGDRVTSLSMIKDESTTAIAVGATDNLQVRSPLGVELWSTSYITSGDETKLGYTVLSDVNGDGVSDLAILTAADKLEVWESDGGECSYRSHMVFQVDGEHYIDFLGTAPDTDNNGAEEIAYFERCYSSAKSYVPPVLVLRSPVDGRVFLESQQGWLPYWNLSCADLDGDGWPDSILCQNQSDLPRDSIGKPVMSADGPVLQIFSGKDGQILWTHMLSIPYPSLTIVEVPAMPIGDINGDGAVDILLTAESWEDTCLRSDIVVYDVLHDAILLEFPVDPVPSLTLDRIPIATEHLVSLGDVDGDGSAEIAIGIDEAIPIPGRGTKYLDGIAVISIQQEKPLAFLIDIDPGSCDMFSAQGSPLGIAAYGAVRFVDMNTNLRLTCPVSGSKSNSPLMIAWEEDSLSDSVEVFVDGVRQGWRIQSGSRLSLPAGKHDLVIRSLDDCGRMSSAAAHIEIRDSLLEWSLLVLVLFISGGSLFALLYPRLALTFDRRRRQRATGQIEPSL